MDNMLTVQVKFKLRLDSLIPGKEETPKHVQTYFYGGDDATKFRIVNMKKKVKNSKEIEIYEKIFKRLYYTLIEGSNKYIKSFLGVKDYVEKNLKEKVLDVKLSIYVNKLTRKCVYKGRLNVPTVDKIANLIPNDDFTTEDHHRYITVNYSGDKKYLKSIPIIIGHMILYNILCFFS